MAFRRLVGFTALAVAATGLVAPQDEVAAQERCFTVDTENTCTVCHELGCSVSYDNGAGSGGVVDRPGLGGKFLEVFCSRQPPGVIGCTSATLTAVECDNGPPVHVEVTDFSEDSSPASALVPDCLEDVRIFVEVGYVP